MTKKFNCPKCNGELKIRDGQHGKFYGCSNFPECKFTLSPSENKSNKLNEKYIVKEKYDIDISLKLSKFLLKNSDKNVVYIIKVNKNSLIKIGKSVNYISRLKQLNNEHQGITPVLLWKTRFHSAFEVFLHEVFDDFLRDKKEYFDIPPEYLIELPKIKMFLGENVEIMPKEKIELSKILPEIIQKPYKKGDDDL